MSSPTQCAANDWNDAALRCSFMEARNRVAASWTASANRFSLDPKWLYAEALDLPASSAIACMVAPLNPHRVKNPAQIRESAPV